MCTLSFLPEEDGYLVAMNRDELLTRAKGLPPKMLRRNEKSAIYPSEPSGGTWIACHDSGNVLALLNWSDANHEMQSERSRGRLIPELIWEPDSMAVWRWLKTADLAGILPFRLIGIFGAERIIREWRWDGFSLVELALPWVRRHWFSSSLSDATASAIRGETFSQASTLSPRSLRQLHRCHEPRRGAFSICVHRPDAETVSYAEVVCANARISMSYLDGSPCLKRTFDNTCELSLIQVVQSPS